MDDVVTMKPKPAPARGGFLPGRGFALAIEAERSCVALRRARKAGASTVVTRLFGAIRDHPSARTRFFDLLDGAP